MSPTQRSLEWARENGYIAEKVEYWNQYAKVRHDLFGFIDIIAIHPTKKETLGIQTTSRSHVSDRLKKIQASEKAKLWVKAGNTIAVHGWKGSDLRLVDVLF